MLLCELFLYNHCIPRKAGRESFGGFESQASIAQSSKSRCDSGGSHGEFVMNSEANHDAPRLAFDESIAGHDLSK